MKIFFIAMFTIASIQLANAQVQNTAVIQLNSIDFDRTMKQKPGILMDVRTSGEYKNGHIEGAGQLNYYAYDFRKNLLLLPKEQAIFLYCNTGYRSEKAAEILVKNGYQKVYNLTHGIMAWNNLDLPVIVDQDAKPDTENKMEPDEFQALIQSNMPVFVDFYAPWCAPCKKMMPEIDRIKTDYEGEIRVVKINVDASSRLVREIGLISVPYLVFYQNGQRLFEHSGLMTRAKFDEMVKSKLPQNQDINNYLKRK